MKHFLASVALLVACHRRPPCRGRVVRENCRATTNVVENCVVYDASGFCVQTMRIEVPVRVCDERCEPRVPVEGDRHVR